MAQKKKSKFEDENGNPFGIPQINLSMPRPLVNDNVEEEINENQKRQMASEQDINRFNNALTSFGNSVINAQAPGPASVPLYARSSDLDKEDELRFRQIRSLLSQS